jgi:hypothetical protein
MIGPVSSVFRLLSIKKADLVCDLLDTVINLRDILARDYVVSYEKFVRLFLSPNILRIGPE